MWVVLYGLPILVESLENGDDADYDRQYYAHSGSKNIVLDGKYFFLILQFVFWEI